MISKINSTNKIFLLSFLFPYPSSSSHIYSPHYVYILCIHKVLVYYISIYIFLFAEKKILSLSHTHLFSLSQPVNSEGKKEAAAAVPISRTTTTTTSTIHTLQLLVLLLHTTTSIYTHYIPILYIYSLTIVCSIVLRYIIFSSSSTRRRRRGRKKEKVPSSPSLSRLTSQHSGAAKPSPPFSSSSSLALQLSLAS